MQTQAEGLQCINVTGVSKTLRFLGAQDFTGSNVCCSFLRMSWQALKNETLEVHTFESSRDLQI